MATRPPTASELAAARPHLPLALYDGACVFCTTQAERARRIAAGRVRVEPLQASLALVPWVDPDDALDALHLVDRDGRSYAGAAAIVRLVRLAHPVLGVALLPYHLPGVRWLAERAYAAVARRRYAIAGRHDGCGSGTCGVPWAERATPAQSTSTGRPASASVRSSTPPSSASSQRE